MSKRVYILYVPLAYILYGLARFMRIFQTHMFPRRFRIFFFLNCFLVEQKSLLYIFSSAAPQRTAYSEVPSQMAAHLRIGNPLYAEEVAGFKPRTAVSQCGVATTEPPLQYNSRIFHFSPGGLAI